MIDVLGAVNDFILAYVGNNEIQLLTQEQVFRGWQNFVSVGPQDTQEYAVLTLLSTVRHGTNIHYYRHAQGATGLVDTVSRLAEHMVQVDFCSAFPNQTEEHARIRAEILEILTRDRVAIDFFKSYGFSSCYADDVLPMPFVNEAENKIARYIVTMHISGYTATNINIDSFSNVDIKIRSRNGSSDGGSESNTLSAYFENVDVHHNNP